MKRKLIYRPEAIDDLNEVERYTKRSWDAQQAKRYVAALVADIKALRISALRYAPQDEILPGLRRKRSGMHHIYFLADAERVEVLKVLHVQSNARMRLRR